MTTKAFPPAELEAARAQIAKEDAEARAAAQAEALTPYQALIDAGLGSDKKTTLAAIISALKASRALVPHEDFSPLNAALTGLEPLHNSLTQKLAPPVAMPTPTVG